LLYISEVLPGTANTSLSYDNKFHISQLSN
jgi:hypothetical protein